MRPLSALGEQQARGIAQRFADLTVKRILSSPAVRCLQTVAPLGERLGVEVEVDERLFEGTDGALVDELLHQYRDDHVVLCSHGDVIPDILHRLVDQGMQPEEGLRWAKASAWAVERTDGEWGVGRYVPAPRI